MAVSAAIPATSISALEVTAGSNSSHKAIANAMDARLNASNAILQAVINQILACSNKGKIFTSDASVPNRDTDGCVSVQTGTGEEMTIRTETVSRPLPDLSFQGGSKSSPGDYVVNQGGAGWGGDTGYKYTSIEPFLDDGASGDITFTFLTSNFVHHSCNNRTANIVINPAKSSSDDQAFNCHYDGNPNRHHRIKYKYNATTKKIGFASRIWQGNSLPTSTLLNFRASYSAARVVPATPVDQGNLVWD